MTQNQMNDGILIGMTQAFIACHMQLNVTLRKPNEMAIISQVAVK